MATSGTRTFIRTRDQLITTALRKLGVINENQSPTANQLTTAQEALNVMVQDWQTLGIFLWSVTEDMFRITADTPTITLDSDMVEIQNVCFSKNDADYPLTKLTREEYKSITNKRQEGEPSSYYVDYQLAQPTIYLHPVWEYGSAVVEGSDANIYYCIQDHESTTDDEPITGSDYADDWRQTSLIATGDTWAADEDYYSGIIKLDKLLRLQDFAASDNNPDFPVRFYKAALWGLCLDLAPEFGKDEDAYGKKAEIYLNRAIMAHTETGDMHVQPRRR